MHYAHDGAIYLLLESKESIVNSPELHWAAGGRKFDFQLKEWYDKTKGKKNREKIKT